MKELSIEEKARAYDEAIKKLHEIITMDNKPVTPKEMGEFLFPELKESEDEKIWKALVEMVHDTTGDSLWVDYNVHKEEAIAWLEKQGEHANFINKIQIGDKVTRNEDGVLVNLSQLKRVAKPAEEQGEQKPAEFDDANAKRMFIKALERVEEQNNKGYKLTDCDKNSWWKDFKAYTSCIVEQKPWSEEDEKQARQIERIVHDDGCTQKLQKQIADWFKSLKDRVRPQNITVTDEELAQAKKDAYNDALDKIEYHSGEPTFDDGWSAAIWYLKKKNIRLQSQWKPSEEQMKALNYVVNLMASSESPKENDYYYNVFKDLKEQLKQL